MAETDNPLKRLLQAAIEDFAAWLLAAEIHEVQTVNVELLADAVHVDQLFRITTADRRTTLLHIEFQGKSTHRPMKWRLLEYMTRIANAEPDLDLLSVVFYVGYGAGAHDTGEHVVNGPDGTVSLQWRYRVIRLWQLQAETILALQRPGLLPLIGQTKIEHPDLLFPQVVQQIKQVPDGALQSRLFTTLVALLNDEEMIKMAERLIEQDQLLLDTPFLRRIREEGREEGREAGLKVGQAQGAQMMRRQDILDALILRFDPVATIYRDVQKHLANVNDDSELERIFAAVIRAATIGEFQAALQPPPIRDHPDLYSKP